ncbi:hypothetical protein EC991_005062 [Linnemannia zychae]|nr:hypothetical protein EC991_005062 [Linnemannia zychae]
MNKLRKLYASFNDPTHSLRSLTVNITQLRGLISKDFYKLRLNKTDIPSGPDVETKLGVYRKMARDEEDSVRCS